MNWVTIGWPAMAGACLMLAALQLLIWVRRPSQDSHLLFACAAVAVAVIAIFELAMMHAQTAAEFGTLQRWSHVPAFVVIVSLLAFVRVHLGAGRLWLAWGVCGLRAVILLANFLSGGVNANFMEITALRSVVLWGSEIVSVPEGVINPWSRLIGLSLLGLAAYMLDAVVVLWRQGGEVRRGAVVVAGTIGLTVLVIGTHNVLIYEGIVPRPTLVTLYFMLIVVAISYELGSGVLRATELGQSLKTSNARLRDSEERFRLVVDGSPNSLLMVDGRGTIVLANTMTEKVFGYRRDELIGRPVETLVPAAARPADAGDRGHDVADPRAPQIGAGRNASGRHKDGHEIPLEIGLNPIQSDRGLFVLVTAVDMSERRKMHRVAADLREELVHLSRVAMLGELSGSLAHELNQPLAAIMSNAQAAQRFLGQGASGLAEVRDILQDIVDDDKRAGEVIRRLRSLLKKDTVEYAKLDVNEVVMEVLRLMRSDLLNRGVTVGTELAPQLPSIDGDRIQLQQVLLNLLMNGCDAVEHVPGGNRALVVGSSATDAGGVEIRVADRGRGIAPGDLERIFMPFVTTKAQGLGLGLAVCRTIVNAHGGRIWAAAHAGGGAVFHCVLPPRRESSA